jgi:predicted SAM-dependent methyltransferase/2-polyprenyl-3-methyl-5-hydroxy-6-metoxy-1,4-benzoquinol methylase
MTQAVQNILIELPLEWMKSKITSEAVRTGAYFASMVSAANELGWTVETTPALMYSDAAPRLPREGQLCISYHSYGEEPNVWRVKEGYLPEYFTLDRLGYSGFSELARYPERFRAAIDSFDLKRAQNIIERNRLRFLDANVSKYDQPHATNAALPSSYLFFPLQTVHDSVQRFACVSQLDAIRRISNLCEQHDAQLVIKRHPFCQDASTTAILEEVTRLSSVTLVEGPISTLIAGAKAVFGANSGVLFEALLAEKPVFSFASSDFSLATHQIRCPEDFARVFTAPEDDTEDRQRFLGWYLSEYCFESDDVAGIAQRLQQLQQLQQLDQEYMSNVIDEFSRRQIKEIYSEAELARRLAVGSHETLEATRSLVALNMLRDAYNVGADAKLKSGLSVSKNNALIKMLPQNKRDVLRQDYYERMHNEEEGYKQNNWLVEYLPALLKVRPHHLVEVGCGNGKFLRRAAPVIDRITGCDWVETPTLPLSCPNVDFKQIDLTKDDVPRGDIVCSADVLEHMPVESVPKVLNTLVSAAPLQFHVIACYDDGHSHLSVFDPATWLALFRSVIPDAWLFDISPRFNDSSRPICVITNVPFSIIGDPSSVRRPTEVAETYNALPTTFPSPLRLDLGAAAVKTPGFLSVDVRKDSGAEIISNMIDLPEPLKGKVDAIRCRHSLEHLERAEALRALQMWKSFLKPGAELNIVVPDLEFHARQFIGEQKSSFPDQYEHAMAGFYGWCDPVRGGTEWDNHRWGYSFESLRKILEECGYTNIIRMTEGIDSEPWHLSVTCSSPQLGN